MNAARRFALAALAAVAVAACALYDVPGRPILADNQIFFFLAERASVGVPPHVSMADPKTQASTLATAAAIAAGRAAGIEPLLSFRLVSVAAATAGLLAAFLLAEALCLARDPRRSRALLAGLVSVAALLSVDGYFLEAASGGRPHLFVAAFALLAHLALARGREVAAGAAAAFAFLSWQPSAVVLGALGLALLLSRERPIARTARLVLGASLVALAYECWFLAKGAALVQLDQEFVLPLGSIHAAKALGESLWFVLTDARPWRTAPRPLPAAFLACILVAWSGALRRPRAVLETMRERPAVSAAWIAVHVGFAFTVYEHQAHPDLLLVQPYYGVVVGLAVSQAVFAAPRRVRRLLAAATAACAVAAGLFAAQRGASGFGGSELGLEEQRVAARTLALYREQHGSLWVLGPVHLLALEGLDNWTGYGFFWDDLERRIDTRAWRPLAGGRMPEVIVTGRGLLPGSAGWRNLEYEEATPVFLRTQRLRVFFRRTDADDPRPSRPKPAPAAGPARTERPVRAADGQDAGLSATPQ